MPVRAQVLAALARVDLSPEARRRLVGQVKAQAFVDHLGDAAKRTFALKNGATVTISNPSLDTGGESPILRFHAKVARANGTVLFDDDHAVVNPPIMHPDGGFESDGLTPTYAENLPAVLKSIIMGHLK